MRKLLYILLAFIIPCSSNAQRRSKEELYAIAHSILSKSSQEIETKSNIRVKESDSEKVKLIYSFNASLPLNRNVDNDQYIDSEIYEPGIYIYSRDNGKPGYVILSASEQTHPLLAFSKDEHIDINSMPEATFNLLQMYALRSDKNELSSRHLRCSISNKPSDNSGVEPLLGDIKYNQRNPYNSMCPIYNGSSCLLGCLPTAMAEIMAYYKYPQRMDSSLGDINFSTNTYGINATWNCKNTVFDWKNICDTYINYAPITQVFVENSDILSFLGFGHSDQKFKIQLNDITNISGISFVGELQLLLADKQGNFITTAGDGKMIDNFPCRSKYKELDISITMPQSLTDGEYHIYFAVKPLGKEKWSIVRRAKSDSSSDRYDTSSFVDEFISVYKEGNYFSYDGQLFPCGYDEQQGQAISILCGACAHAAHADFGNSQTPATSTLAVEALVNYMNYSNEIRYMKPEYFEPAQWHTYIQDELESRRPLLISGKSGNGAHAFIIDGYQYIDGIPYYHVNWGWNGLSNGYYILDYLKPSEAGDGGYENNYGEYISIFSHVQPSNDNNFTNQLACTSITLDKNEYTEGENIHINIQNLSNRTIRTLEKGELQIYLVDEFRTEFFLGKIINLPELKFCYYYKDLNKSIKIPSTIPTGNYFVDLRLIGSNSSEYSHVQNPSPIKLNITNVTSCKNICNDALSMRELFDLSGRKLTPSNGRKIVITERKKIVH